MNHTIRQATVQDAIKIAPLLRPEDRRECIGMSGMTPEVMLPGSVLSCQDGETIYAESTSGEPILIGGVSRSSPLSAWVWMMGTPEIKRHRWTFLRSSLPVVERWNAKFPLLHNYADFRNSVHLAWLEWLGFTIINVHTFPHLDFRVAEFTRIAKCVPSH